MSCLCSANALCLFIGIFVFFCACGLVLPMFYASLFYYLLVLCLCLGFANVLFLFICIFISFLLWQCVLVLTMFYASLYIFFFSLMSVAWFWQCSMPLYLYFSFVSVTRFSQCSVHLYLYFFLFFCICGLVLPMFYASLLYFFLCVGFLI